MDRGLGSIPGGGGRGRAARALGAAVAVLLLCTSPAWASHNVYAGNSASDPNADTGDGSIQPFNILGDGSLADLGDPVDSRDTSPAQMVVSPDNSHLYVVNTGFFTGQGAGTREVPPGSLATFAIATDGTLTPQGDLLGTGRFDFGPDAVAITPDGRELFVVNSFSDNDRGSVQPYAIGPDGTPTPIGDPVDSQGYTTAGVAVSPDGHHLYVVNEEAPNSVDGNVAEYTINADGTLTALAASPVSTGGSVSSSIGFAPDGSHVYVANDGSDTVTVFSVSADGSLTMQGSPVSTGSGPMRVVVAPDGRHLYVPEFGSGDVAVFTIAADGSLTAGDTPAVDGSTPSWASLSPDGSRLYVSLDNIPLASPQAVAGRGQETRGAVETFAVDPSTGALTEVGTPAPTNGNLPRSVVVSPDQGPVAAFSSAPGQAGATTTFNGSGSSDSDGTVVRYDWDFGDGSSAANAGATPSHVYAAPGTYNVTLTVTDNAGCSLTVTSFGQMDYCNGGPAARISHAVTIVAPAPSLVAPSRALRLALRVTPSRVFVHSRHCFRFTVTAAGKRVRGATVRFVGRRGLTNGRGQTTICTRLTHVRRYTAVASKRGATSARAHVRAVRPRVVPRPRFTG